LSVTRRGLLAASGISGLLVGCGGPPERKLPTSTPKSGRLRYGEDHPNQFADLRMPDAAPLATVVLLHGGYWLPPFGVELMEALAVRFTDLGYATWNVDYRRTGDGGGFPQTLSDVATAIDRLSGEGLPSGLDENVVVVGHSAGGQLAVWAGSRGVQTPGGEAKVRPRGVVSLAGILDLVLAGSVSRSMDPVRAFMGGDPTDLTQDYALADPSQLVPPNCPVWAVHAKEDDTVPPEQSTGYVALAKAVGGAVERVVVPGNHSTIIDPSFTSFPAIRRLVSQAAT
jgi:acetyl esterase/lipase